MTPADLVPAIFLAVTVALALPSPVRGSQPIGGLQEVPLRDLETDRGGVCAARPRILVKNFGPGSDPAGYLDAAQACGARVVVYFSETTANGHVHPELVSDLVAAVKGHPALYGYLTVKEPSLTGVSGAEIRTLYAAFKRADPSKPVVALLTDLPGVGTTRNPLARGMADVVMFDWYPVGRRGYRAGSCATLSHAAAVVRAIGARVWIMVQAHRYDAGGKARPTPAQMRRQVAEAVSCARAGTVVAHIWSHAAYQSDLRRNPALFGAFLGATF
jgi:hypothetical protein